MVRRTRALGYDGAMRTHAIWTATALLISTTSAWAQAPEEPKTWTITASTGLSLTSGNTDTSTVNASYDLTYDRQARNVVKSDALLIRGKTEGELTGNRLGVNIRDEFKLGDGVFVFGQNQYLRDEFKDIDYLVAPGVGVGFQIFDTMSTRLSIDAGAGGVWEKNPGVEVRSSGAVTAAEKFSQTLTATTVLTQSVTALWKTKEWNDSLYNFAVGISVGISARTQLKVEVLDTYKNLPPSPEVEKNDVAVLMAIVYKM
jgi:putative salt-induced outer membrane protein YdiY